MTVTPTDPRVGSPYEPAGVLMYPKLLSAAPSLKFAILLVLAAVVRSVKVRGILTVDRAAVTLVERVTQEVTPSGCTLPGGKGVSSRYDVVQVWVPSLVITR